MSSADLENSPERDVLTIPEAAKRLGVCPKLLRRARDERKLPVYRIGTSWDRVIWPEVLTWLRGHRMRPSDTDWTGIGISGCEPAPPPRDGASGSSPSPSAGQDADDVVCGVTS